MISVLIIDDHPIVLQGCRRVLEDAGIEPILAASDLVAGYRLYLRHRPDVAIVDLAIQGKGLGGLELIRRIKAHDTDAHILVLSMHNDPVIVARSLEAGASGYVLKDTSSEELVKAVQQVSMGMRFLSGDLAMKVALTGTSARTNPLADLTPRELQVLALLAEGKPYDSQHRGQAPGSAGIASYEARRVALIAARVRRFESQVSPGFPSQTATSIRTGRPRRTPGGLRLGRVREENIGDVCD